MLPKLSDMIEKGYDNEYVRIGHPGITARRYEDSNIWYCCPLAAAIVALRGNPETPAEVAEMLVEPVINGISLTHEVESLTSAQYKILPYTQLPDEAVDKSRLLGKFISGVVMSLFDRYEWPVDKIVGWLRSVGH